MTRVRRFTNTYGNHTLKQMGWSQYQPGASGGWIGTTTPKHKTTVRATRLVPRKSDGFMPTEWGAFAERIWIPPFDYQTEGPKYRWRGEGDTTTMQVLTLPVLWPVLSTTGVSIALPLGMSDASALRASNAIKDQVVDIGVALAEARETLGYLSGLAFDVATSLRKAKERKFGEAVSALLGGTWGSASAATKTEIRSRWKANLRRKMGGRHGKETLRRRTASNWLEYSLVLRPFIADVYGLAEQLTRKTREGIITCEGAETNTWSTRELFPSASLNSHHFGGAGLKLVSKTCYKIRVADDDLYRLSQLGLTNPASIAWELATLSFVVDWFVPIGAFLEGITASVGTTFVSGFETRVFELDVRVDYCRYGHSGYVSGETQKLHHQAFAMQRIRKAWVAVPSLLSLFRGKGLNTTRALTAVSLLAVRS